MKPVALRRLTLGAAVAAVALASPPAVTPAAAFELSTAYPGVAIGPGQTTTFALHVTSTRRERVELAVTQARPGWGRQAARWWLPDQRRHRRPRQAARRRARGPGPRRGDTGR